MSNGGSLRHPSLSCISTGFIVELVRSLATRECHHWVSPMATWSMHRGNQIFQNKFKTQVILWHCDEGFTHSFTHMVVQLLADSFKMAANNESLKCQVCTLIYCLHVLVHGMPKLVYFGDLFNVSVVYKKSSSVLFGTRGLTV